MGSLAKWQTTEARVWSNFSKLLPKTTHIVRVENWVGCGAPDVNLCWEGREVWIENKLASPAGTVRFEAGQIAWIRRRCRVRGRIFVLVYWHSDYNLYSGNQVMQLEESGVSRVTPIAHGVSQCLEKIFE